MKPQLSGLSHDECNYYVTQQTANPVRSTLTITDFIWWNTHWLTTATEASDNATSTTTATIPHIKGISENISLFLQPFNIHVVHKPITTLCQLLTNIKDQDKLRNRQEAVYKINCSDCYTSYINETDRNQYAITTCDWVGLHFDRKQKIGTQFSSMIS